jgi:hypothetical protein
MFLPSRRDNADIRPAWSDLRRAARGGKPLTPVKWTPQSRLMGKFSNGKPGDNPVRAAGGFWRLHSPLLSSLGPPWVQLLRLVVRPIVRA